MNIDKLYAEYYASVYKSIYSIVRHKEDAEDVSQNTWLSIYVKQEIYDSSQPFLNWAITIGRNLAIDFIRREKKELIGFQEYVEFVSPEYPLTVDIKIINMANSRVLGKYRIICSLRYGSNLSIREISKITELPVGTIQWMLTQSRNKILGTNRVNKHTICKKNNK